MPPGISMPGALSGRLCRLSPAGSSRPVPSLPEGPRSPALELALGVDGAVEEVPEVLDHRPETKGEPLLALFEIGVTDAVRILLSGREVLRPPAEA